MGSLPKNSSLPLAIRCSSTDHSIVSIQYKIGRGSGLECLIELNRLFSIPEIISPIKPAMKDQEQEVTYKVCLMFETAESCLETEALLRYQENIDVTKVAIEDYKECAGDMLIFDVKVMNLANLKSLLLACRTLKNVPTLIMADEIPIEIYRKVAMLPHVVTLQKPASAADMKMRMQEMASRLEAVPNRFPRFKTDQPTRMVFLRTGLLVPSRMKNYSVGGAFLEYNGISLKVGDHIQIGFHSSEQPFQLQAKVIWMKTEADRRTRGVGVQFLDPLPHQKRSPHVPQNS